ncbi:MAG: hypothetical protein QMD14_05645 [Candidatus Aenigmarchaeota archaeon]|nr:hypothetical protein [Candidatus Aenigmarchaeota archaeon]
MLEPIELNCVAELFDVNRWKLAKYFRIIYGMRKVPQQDVKSYIRKYARELGLPDESVYNRHDFTEK